MSTARSRATQRAPHVILFPVVVAAACWMSACAPTAPYTRTSGRSTAAAPGRAPSLSLHGITAEVDGNGRSELVRLRTERSPTARLREAYVLQETGELDLSIQVLNRLIYGNERHGPSIEAYARYLSARAFDKNGEPERADHERELAAELAIDDDLREHLALITGPRGPREGAGPRPANPSGRLAILARSEWQAQSPLRRRMVPMGRVSRITVHHSANPTTGQSRSTAVAAIRGVQRYHLSEMGWGDIGYHFLIDPAGRVWAGRSIEWQGAHAGDGEKNRENIGVCLLGDYTPTSQGPPEPAQMHALELLLADLAARYHVEPRQILTHRELKPTSCPGPYLQAAVQRIRAAMASGDLAAAGAGH